MFNDNINMLIEQYLCIFNIEELEDLLNNKLEDYFRKDSIPYDRKEYPQVLDDYAVNLGAQNLEETLYEEIENFIGKKFINIIRKGCEKAFTKADIIFLSDESYFPITKNKDENKKMELIQYLNSFSNEKKEPLVFYLFKLKEIKILNREVYVEVEAVSTLLFQKKEYLKVSPDLDISFFYDIELFKQNISQIINNLSNYFETEYVFSAVLISKTDRSKTEPNRDNDVQVFNLFDDEDSLQKVA